MGANDRHCRQVAKRGWHKRELVYKNCRKCRAVRRRLEQALVVAFVLSCFFLPRAADAGLLHRLGRIICAPVRNVADYLHAVSYQWTHDPFQYWY